MRKGVAARRNAVKTKSSPQQSVGFLQTARRGVPGVEREMIGEWTLQQAAVEPVTSPPYPQGRRQAAQHLAEHFGQELQV